MNNQMKRLYRVAEAAQLLGLSPKTIRFWVWQRRIDVVRIGRAVRIPEEAVQKLVERGLIPAKDS